jgi:O-succinylbenzoate synthase
MLTQLRLYEYALPIKPKNSLKGFTRKGLILESPEHQLYAEASPLPGCSQESYEEALAELHSLLPHLLHISSQLELSNFLQRKKLYPSVRFCIHALFDQLFFPLSYPLSIPIRHYIDIPYEGTHSSSLILQNIQALYRDSSQTFKIKLGPYPIEQARILLRSILDSYPCLLHLDMNSQWTLQDLCKLCDCFDKHAFYCLEDGVNNLQDLTLFASRYPHPLSIDHLLRTYSIHPFLTLPSLKSCEFKPSLDMNMFLDSSLSSLLQEKSISYTFSSLYESGIGIAAIARLGARHIPSSCLGIDTLGVFSQSLSSFFIENSQMILPHPLQVDHTHLSLYATSTLPHR